MRLVHDCGPILEQEKVREQFNVLGCVLDLVPLALYTRTKIPVARCPSTHSRERLQVGEEVLAHQSGLIMISVSDRVHDEAHAYDAGAVNQPGTSGWQIPSLLERLGSGAPICLEDSEHRFHIPCPRVWIPEAI